jgi:DNA mismatch endonuclease (patch repair protein)
MARIGGSNTKPERRLRSALHRLGFRFRLHPRSLPGRPDIVLPKYRAVILVHGCFWHRHLGCKLAYMPKSRVSRWQAKFDQNVVRDRRVTQALVQAGWRIWIVWECKTRSSERMGLEIEKLVAWLRERNPGPSDSDKPVA